MTTAYIGLGSNLGDPARQIKTAFKALNEIPSTRVLTRSSLYRSSPLGARDQPDFINACACVDTQLTAHALLSELQEIETRQGRVRTGEHWGPRTLDLDLLVFGAMRIEDEDLTVPHRELPNRAFVLAPLAEIAPDLVVPGLGHVQDLADTIGTGSVMRLADP